MARKYSEEELTRALLLIIDQGVSPTEASKQTGINLRAIQRFRMDYEGRNPKTTVSKATETLGVFNGSTPIATVEVQQQLDKTLLARAKYLDDIFEAKQIIIENIKKLGKKSKNIDALQRSLKTLSDLDAETKPAGEGSVNPAFHAKTVNMFQFFNQQLIDNGYKGPELKDADIVKGD